MASDIQRLRQQYTLAPMLDMGGGMDIMGGSSYAPPPSMNYMPTGPMGGRYNPPPIADETPPSSPFDFLRQPSTGPTFPDQGTMAPRTVQAPGGGTNTMPPSMTLQEYLDAINKAYTPDFTDRDRMRANLDAVPVRERPSFARSLVAAALSTKAEDPIATAEKVQYAPHYRAMADWTAKNEPFYKAADLENRQNINERTLMTNAVTAKTNADKLAESARQADLKNEQALGRNRIAQMKAQLGQGYKIIARGTTIKILNTATGEVRDTGMSTGWMNEEDRIDAEGEWRDKAAQTAADAAASRIQQGGTNIFQSPDGRRWIPDPDNPGQLKEVTGGPPTSIYKPGTTPRTGTGTGTRTNTLETRRQIQDRLAELYQTDPIAKKHIVKQTGGGYAFRDRPVVSEASGWGPWAKDAVTQEQVDEYDQIRSEVDPSYKIPTRTAKPAAPAETGGVGPSGTTPNRPTAEGGRGGGPGLGPTKPPQTGRGGGPGGEQKQIVKREYSPSRNQTRITYSDGTTQMLPGKQ